MSGGPFEEILRSISLVADSSLAGYTGFPGLPGSAVPNTGKQYRFVKVTGKIQVGLATAGTDRAVGILQNKPQKLGEAATVAVFGASLVISGAGDGTGSNPAIIAPGDLVVADAEGRAIKAPASNPSSLTGTATTIAVSNGIATITESAAHNLIVADSITLSGATATSGTGSTNQTGFNATHTVLSVPSTTTYTISVAALTNVNAGTSLTLSRTATARNTRGLGVALFGSQRAGELITVLLQTT